MTKHLENLTRGLIYMEFSEFSLKTTTLHSGVVMQKNKFISL